MHSSNILFKVFLLLLAFAYSATLNAQDTTRLDGPCIRKSSVIPLPIVFYTPETRFGGGGALLYAFRFRRQSEQARPSQFQLGFAYTQERQVLFYLPFQIFTYQSTYNIRGELGYYRYVYRLYGIGNNTPEEMEERFQANYPRLRLDATRQVLPSFYTGFRFWFDDYEVAETEAGRFLETARPTGSEGSLILGGGPLLIYDSRDAVFYPRKGYLIELEGFFNWSDAGMSSPFSRFALDAARYFSFHKNQVLAANIWLVSTHGDPPFQQLALLGGPKKMRGYFEGRFRDRKLWLIQAEYRIESFWRLGFTIFGAMGAVSPSWAAIVEQQAHYTFGAGLRVMLSKADHINLRLDVGINDQGGLFPYLTVGEAF